MNKTIISCGGWKGDSIPLLRKKYGKDIIIHTFEPNPLLAKYYDGLNNHVFHSEAAWIKKGELELWLMDIEDERGSSVFETKKNDKRPELSVTHAIKVPCIDFSQWIKNSFQPDDYLILKMNMEGAEYHVLNKMIDDETIYYIKEAEIHFHHFRYPNMISKKEHEYLLSRLPRIPNFNVEND